jgi:hypothetical protein
MKHINFVKRGWITLDVTPASSQADFWEIDGVEADDAGDPSFRIAFTVTAGTPRLEQASGATEPRGDAPELAPGMPEREIPIPRDA